MTKTMPATIALVAWLGFHLATHSAHAEEKPVTTIMAHSGGAYIVGISPDSRVLYSRGEDGTKKWDLATGKEVAIPKLPGKANALSPNGKVLALTDDLALRLWDLEIKKELFAVQRDLPLGGPVFSSDGKWVAAGWTMPSEKPGQRQGAAALWDVSTGKKGLTLAAGSGALIGLAPSSNAQFLAAGTSDFPLIGDLTVWSTSPGEVETRIPANGVRCLTFSPDGKVLAAGFLANYREGKRSPITSCFGICPLARSAIPFDSTNPFVQWHSIRTARFSQLGPTLAP